MILAYICYFFVFIIIIIIIWPWDCGSSQVESY